MGREIFLQWCFFVTMILNESDTDMRCLAQSWPISVQYITAIDIEEKLEISH